MFESEELFQKYNRYRQYIGIISGKCLKAAVSSTIIGALRHYDNLSGSGGQIHVICRRSL
jgi:hypothetical protein